MKIKLLVIDDDLVSLLIAKKYLTVAGFNQFAQEIQLFTEPVDALKLLLEEERGHEMLPIWILLDINMPVLNGWDFLSRVESAELKRNIKVIMLTSSISDEDKDRAASYKLVHGYVIKPMDIQKCNDIKQLILKEEV